MNPEAFRVALQAREARGCLTDRQNEAIDAFLLSGSVAGAAKRLGVSRAATRKLLGFALKKVETFAESISHDREN